MADKKSDLELIQMLKYIDPIAGTDPVPVTGWPIFRNSVGYTQEQYSAFVGSLVTSSTDIVDPDERQRALEVLQETLNGIQSARAYAGKLRGSPNPLSNPGEPARAITNFKKELDLEFEAGYRGGYTAIGPVVLSNDDCPIKEVFVTEEYDIELLKTLRGISDPVLKGHRNKVMFTLTIEFNGHTINGEASNKAVPSLRRLLATLRACPIVEIESDSIIPIFMNSILTPDLQRQLRKEVSTRTIEKINKAEGKRDTIENYLLSKYTEQTRVNPKAPPNAPSGASLLALPQYEVTSVQDGDTFYINATVNGSNSIRLEGIGCPETAKAAVDGRPATNGEPGGEEAKTYLTELLAASGNLVRLEWDKDLNERNGRNVCYVYLSDGTQANLKLIQQGHAKPYPHSPNLKYEAAYRDTYLASVYKDYNNFKSLLSDASPIIDFLMAPDDEDKSHTTSKSDTPSTAQRLPGRFSVAAAFAGFMVYTDPKRTNTLMAKLSFIKFNDDVFQSGKVLYRDSSGNKTTNPFNCPWIDRLAEFMYLGYSARDAEGSVHYMSPYWSPGPTESLMEFTWSDPYSSEEQKYTVNPEEAVIESIVVQGTPKMVTLPIAGRVYPVCQYMGADNLMATIQVKFHSRLELARFHEMKAELDQINYDTSPNDRKAVVRIKNNVLNFAGAKDFVVTRIDTQISDNKNVHSAEIRLIESRISPQEVEAITLKNGDKAVLNDLKKVWKHIYSLLSRQEKSPDDPTQRYILPGDSEYQKLKYPHEFDLAYDLIFGKEGQRNGVSTFLNPNALAATYYSLAIQQLKGGKHEWNTEVSYAGGIGARMDVSQLEVGGNTGFNPAVVNPDAISFTTSSGIVSIQGPTNPHSLLGDPRSVVGKMMKLRALPEIVAWPNGSRNAIRDDGEDLIEFLGTTGRRDLFFTENAWNEYFDVVMTKGLPDMNPEGAKWTTEDLASARSALLSLASSGIMYNFVSLHKRGKYGFETLNLSEVEESDIVVSANQTAGGAIRRTNYADIRLPTYADLFGTSLVSASDNPSKQVELWKRFAPTYDDLGKEPPLDLRLLFTSEKESSKLVARSIHDQVEPDFVYWHEKTKTDADKGMDERGVNAALNYIAAHTIAISSDDLKSQGLTAKDYWKQMMNSPARKTITESFDRQNVRDRAEKENLVFSSGSNVLVTQKGDNGATATQFNLKKAGADSISAMDTGFPIAEVGTLDTIKKNRRSVISQYPDRSLSMLRLYPAYRLYFVEEDRETAYLVDDLYGTNCVVSLHLRKNKDEPDTLTAQLSNVTDNLGTESVIPELTAQNLGLLKDDEGEMFFSQLKLAQGVMIQLRMGYGSKPDDLEVVFTGVITDITPGKVVTLVAQGHKRELLNEVQFATKSTSYFDVIHKALLKTKTTHLGRTLTVDQLADKRLQSLVGPGVDVKDEYGSWERFLGQEITSATQNVYLQSAKEFGSGVPFLGTPGWIAPPMPAWEVLKEVTRHFPGHIVEVVPRGVDGTIFIGKANQPYLAEKPLPREEFIYDRYSRKLSQSEKFPLEELVLVPFLNRTSSNEFEKYINTLNRQTKDASEGSSSGAALSSAESPIDRDYTVDWRYLNDISPELASMVYYWYFDIDPQKATVTGIAVEFMELDVLFLGREDSRHRDLIKSLQSGTSAGVARTMYARTKPDDSTVSDQSSRAVLDNLLSQRVSSGLITETERAEALRRFDEIVVQQVTYVPRDLGGDPSLAIGPASTLNMDIAFRGGPFKLFVYHLAEDLRKRSRETSQSEVMDKIRSAASKNTFDRLPPGWKVFRGYHSIGPRDIIDNSISASTENMANSVLIRAPDSKSFLGSIRHSAGVNYKAKSDVDGEDAITVNYEDTQWVSWPTNDGLAFNERVAIRNRKLAVIPELNAMDGEQKNRVMMSNMALSIQGMYRGTLTVVGRHIKPHDIVYIDDRDKDLVGHFEVATVTHHFTSATGWVSVIEPHALVTVNSPTQRIELAIIQDFLDAVEPVVGAINIAITVLSVIGVIASFGSGAPAVAVGGEVAKTGVRAAVSKAANWVATKIGSKIATEAMASSRAFGIAKAIGGHFTRHWGKMASIAGGSQIGLRLTRLLTNIDAKARLAETTLPLSVHLLLYRGHPFQAGLDTEDRDIYSIEDRFGYVWNETKNQVGSFFWGVLRSTVGRGNLHPLDQFEKEK